MKRPQEEAREPRVAFGQRDARDRSQRAGQHRRAADPRRRKIRGASDGVDEHAFERALPQVARDEPHDEILLVARRAGEQPPEDLSFGVRRARTGRRANAGQRLVDLREVEGGMAGRRDVTRRVEGGAAKPDPALSWCAAEKGGRDLDFVRGGPLEQRGETIDLFQASARPRDAGGGLDKLREPHPVIVAQMRNAGFQVDPAGAGSLMAAMRLRATTTWFRTGATSAGIAGCRRGSSWDAGS